MSERTRFRAGTAERFWSKVRRADEQECWLWLGARANGYGRFLVGGKLRQAHRVAWMLTKGPVGDLFVCHHCDNPPCVNPARGAHGTPEPHHSWRDAGYFRVRVSEVRGAAYIQTLVTPRGLIWLSRRYPADPTPGASGGSAIAAPAGPLDVGPLAVPA